MRTRKVVNRRVKAAMTRGCNKLAELAVLCPIVERGHTRMNYNHHCPDHDTRIAYENYACIVNLIAECVDCVTRTSIFGTRYVLDVSKLPGLVELIQLHQTFLTSEEHAPFVSDEMRAVIDEALAMG